MIVDDQDDKNNKNKRKSKGGAEKSRDKKRKLLEKDASECKKITDMFPTASTSKNKDNIMEVVTDSSNLLEQPIASNSFGNEIDKISTQKISSKDKFLIQCLRSDTSKSHQTPKRDLERKISNDLFLLKSGADINDSTETSQVGQENLEKENSYGNDTLKTGQTPERSLEKKISEDKFFSHISGADVNDTSESFQPPEETLKGKISGEQIYSTNQTFLADSSDNFNYFKRPKPNELNLFFKYHPQQSINDPVLQNAFYREKNVNRQWLSYDAKNKALFCTVCLAFAQALDYSVFIKGCTDRKHFHQRINEHETSKSHISCAQAYLLYAKKSNIEHLMSENQMSLRSEQVKKRRMVMERIIEVVKFIGKRCLSYRGKDEAAYSLENEEIDHGNFLELILLLSKYDSCLQQHVTESIEKSKTQHLNNVKKQKSSKRGNLVTMLSKTTVNYIIEAIGSLIKAQISEAVNLSGMFSVQIDTAQDISVKSQCSIVVRYVLDKVYERVIAVKHSESGTGKNLCNLLLVNAIEECNIVLSKCVGNATDGAANMQGEYEGMSTYLNDVSPGQFHVWCYGHILNLVITDSTCVSITAATLFSLLNAIAVFVRDSYKRSDIWNKFNEKDHRKKLEAIGQTRWWSKHSAVNKVYGSFSNQDKALYVELILTLEEIIKSTNLTPQMRATANGFLKSLLEYETVLTAFIFLRIFETTTPLSKYLQTSGLDILKAYNMVCSTRKKLTDYSRDFETVKKQADKFIILMNGKLEKTESESRLAKELPSKRSRIVKSMPGETARHEVVTDSLKFYEINTHNVILDKTVSEITRRFSKNGSFYADLSILDPKNFEQIKKNPENLKAPIMEELSKVLIKFDPNATAENLRSEFESFISNWDFFKLTAADFYEVKTDDFAHVNLDELDEDFMKQLEDFNEDFDVKSCVSCKSCCFCCYSILLKYNLLTSSYKSLTLAYQYLLTLSISQVSCERSFSILKIIKNRLRSLLSQENLEPLMLMACEKDILKNLKVDIIMDKVAEKSKLLKNLLIS